MAEIKEIIRCYNCGVILQSEDPSKPGYIKKEVLESERQSFFFCDECFEKERHHQPTHEPKVERGVTKIIEEAKAKGSLFVYVINSFSFESSFARSLCNALKGAELIVLANKVDLLPKNTDLDKFKKYIAHMFLLNGLRIKKDDILLSSLFDEDTTRDILAKIRERGAGRATYLVGAKLSGKRTLIDSILRQFTNNSNESIVSKKYPGTDVRLLRVPLDKKSSIYDIPSIDDNNSILHDIDRANFNKVDARKAIKPRKFTISSRHSLALGGMALIEVLNDKKVTFDVYTSPQVDLVKIGHNHSDTKFIKDINRKNIHPYLSWTKDIRDFDVFEVDINENGLRDIGVQGLGWLTFNADNQAFRVFVPKGVALYTTSSKVLLKDIEEK